MNIQDSELRDLRNLADAIFAPFAAETLDVPQTSIPYDAELWNTLTGSGLTLLTTPESVGGSGATLREFATVLGSAAEHCAPVPLAETDLLASWLLQSAGMAVPKGPLTAALVDGSISNLRVRTSKTRIPWAGAADYVVIADGATIALVPSESIALDAAHNLAGEPRDLVTIDVELESSAVGTTSRDVAPEFELRGALARSIQMCGVLDRALSMAVEHASTRIQFGRSLGKFQAVQHLIADAAGEVAVARAAADFAIEVAAGDGFIDPRTQFAIAVAKSQSGRAAEVVVRNSHQVHGAIGCTLDHRLRHYSSRALAWRAEFGGVRHWDRVLGKTALRLGPSELWNLATMSSANRIQERRE